MFYEAVLFNRHIFSSRGNKYDWVTNIMNIYRLTLALHNHDPETLNVGLALSIHEVAYSRLKHY
jgi:hypothetical protein